MLFTLQLSLWTMVCVTFFIVMWLLSHKQDRPIPIWVEDVGWFLSGLLLFYTLNNGQYVVYNNYLYQAQAFLQGRLDIPDMPLHLESVMVSSRTYMHFAPGPAILALPMVAIFGLDFNIARLAMVLGAANLALITRLLRNLGFDKLHQRVWLTAFIGLGCVHFFCAVLGWSWFVGHVATWFFLLLALVCATQAFKGAVWLAGFFYACAVTCRMPMLLSFPLFAYFIAWRKDAEGAFWQRVDWKRLLVFCAGAVIPGGLYMLFNWLRYGSLMDRGYNLTFAKDYPDRSGGPLGLRYVPYNLYSLLLMAPEFAQAAPYIIPSQAGTSLTFTTPALYYGLSARSPKHWPGLVPVLWVTAVVCAVPFLLNYGNGMAQFSMRYAMDFLPFLLLLAAIRIRAGWVQFGGLARFWITLGIWIQGWGILYWYHFYCYNG